MSERGYLLTFVLVLLGIALVLLISSSGSIGTDNLNSKLTVAEQEQMPSKLEKIKSQVTPIIDEIPAHMTFILTDTKSGETVQINNDGEYIAASLYKLFVAYYAYGQIDEGKISMSTVLSNDRTLDQCLNLMITISDNECGELLGDLFGWANIDTKIHADGFEDTTLNLRNTVGGDIVTTPGDIESFFSRLYSGELLSEDHAEHLMDLLLNQEINNRLPPVIPDNISVAHKTGDVYDYIHDAGFIFSRDEDYVFVMMSSDWSDDMTFGPGYDYFKQLFTIIFDNI